MAKHTYIIVRHGFSLANQSKTIVSSLANGVKQEFGLTEEGKLQAAKSAELLKQHLVSGSDLGVDGRPIFIVSSPFSRAVQTADIFLQVLSSGDGLKDRILNQGLKPDISPELRERNFGELELTSDAGYASVWEEDKTSEHKNSREVEPVASVWARISVLLNKLEMAIPKPSVVILVSHGDTLQITQTAFACEPLSQHRGQQHLVQAEWRVLCNEARKKSQNGFKTKPQPLAVPASKL
eukprot:GILI01033468.1.p1 GENE.GILI01033468.1~~GILI01033468.1.p1  ORF type:complete len:238 (-),score=28.85 GILI01033468.1:68-781(-)